MLSVRASQRLPKILPIYPALFSFLDQNVNSFSHEPTKARPNKDHDTSLPKQLLEWKHKQEEDDFALALKLQQQFDKERRQEQQLERKKGSVDGYMLRKDSCTRTSS